jgi:hypothetical protein
MLGALLGISSFGVICVCAWFAWQCWRAWCWMQSAPSLTIQVMTQEEREAFTEHAKARAMKVLYQEVGR